MNANAELALREESSPTPILHCLICQKPFVQESSYKRHMSYCRKAQNRQRVRKKACQACSSAKTKCTFEKACRRCRLMGLQCSYDQQISIEDIPQRQLPLTSTDIPDVSSSAAINPAARNGAHSYAAHQNEGRFHLPDFDSSLDISLNRSTPSSGGALANIPGHEEILGSAIETQVTVSMSPSHRRSSPSSLLHLERGNTPWSGISSFPNINLIFAPSRTGHGIPSQIHQRMGTLARLQHADPVAQHNVKLIMQSIRAYPYMMLRRETFPPFIHPHWHRQSAPALPWPLANCMSVAKLFVSRTPETVPFLWQTVGSESQRCLDEMNDFSQESLLAAIQVQVMYLIMRLVDGATCPDTLNVQLLITFKVLSQHLKAQNDGRFIGPQPYDWESWIQTESSLRILVVFFLLSQVISVFTGMNCGFIERYYDLPLCSTKGPWEARTNSEWALEYAACPRTKDADMCTIGHMVELEQANRNLAQTQMLDSWNAAADNLGILLNSVALNLAHL